MQTTCVWHSNVWRTHQANFWPTCVYFDCLQRSSCCIQASVSQRPWQQCSMLLLSHQRGTHTWFTQHQILPVLISPRQGSQHNNTCYNPLNLPLQSSSLHHIQLQEMNNADTAVLQEELGMEYSINQLSMLFRLPPLGFPHHFPHDIMHMFFENICPLLIEQWTALCRFKNTDTVDPGYRLAPHIWEQIGHETAEAYKTIPSEFIGALPDISNSKYKTKFSSFWFKYLGPFLLRDRFPNAKYYRHFCNLIGIIKKCLQFTISTAEIDELQVSIVKWVQEYERYANGYFHRLFSLTHWSDPGGTMDI